MDRIAITETTLIWGLVCLTAVSIANTMALFSLARQALGAKRGAFWDVKRRKEEKPKAERPSLDVTRFGNVTGYTDARGRNL